MTNHVGVTCIFLLDAGNKFQTYSPKWCFFMVIPKKHIQVNVWYIYLITNLPPKLTNFVGINISHI